MKVLLIADSPEFEFDYISRRSVDFDCVIVTDGAVHKLPGSVRPTIVCGDFDSIDLSRAQSLYAGAEFLRLEDQEQNDLEKAVVLAIARGASEIVLVSALGGRPDIALANVAVLVRHHVTCALSMVGRGIITRVVSSRAERSRALSFDASAGSAISCIAFEGDSIVSMSNVKWPLSHGTLRAGSHGVSNEALGGRVEICVHEGLVLVSHEL
jgi:thiamine pyrophosphokinase